MAGSWRIGRLGTAIATVIAAPLSALTGCSNVVTTSEAPAGSTVAYVTFDRFEPSTSATTTAAGPEAGTVPASRMYASAYFLRVQADADEKLAARLVGAGLSLPEAGRCDVSPSLEDEGIPLASLGSVALVDVGEVDIETTEAKATLAPRAFPDLVDLVSGVVYTTRDSAVGSLPDRGAYRVQIGGSLGFLPMTLAATAPGPIEELRIGGVSAASGSIMLAPGDLELEWKAPDAASNDVVYVEATPAKNAAARRVRCAFEDVGHAVLRAVRFPAASDLTLQVHRVHREPVEVGAVDGGEIRFDEASTINVHFQVADP